MKREIAAPAGVTPAGKADPKAKSPDKGKGKGKNVRDVDIDSDTSEDDVFAYDSDPKWPAPLPGASLGMTIPGAPRRRPGHMWRTVS